MHDFRVCSACKMECSWPSPYIHMTFCVQATRHFVKEVFLPRASSKGASVVIADVDCVGTPESSNIGALSLCVSCCGALSSRCAMWCGYTPEHKAALIVAICTFSERIRVFF